MNFIGEHLFAGQLGHLLIILAFVASLVSFISYAAYSFEKKQEQKNYWLKLARISFLLEAISILTVFGLVYYICANHLYEYMYVYKHASRELEPKYLLACIWEGQEGSFLLWSIWHVIIGSVFIFKRNSPWESPVLTVINLAQAFMMLMILGIYIGDVRIGNSLFALTRNEIVAPIFTQPNYLDFVKDGMGLNVLLRNYWMVIHPPVLFLGFALTLVPFWFAYGALTSKKFGDWVKPALPWVLLNACVLGMGIMMGGKWAYESLSFGGYWAWDPVENASLVPWLILIAGLHTMLVYNHTGHSLKASFLFIILAFAFVLYSTFLTKTGVLGDASVHSFTDPGKAINIMITAFLATFSLGGLALFFGRFKQIKETHTEEALNSREFWMFIGSLIFFLTALFIIAKTSVPLVNKVIGTNFAPPQDVEFSYNKVAAMIAIIIGMLTAIGQYFKYKSTPRRYFIKKILWPTVIAALLFSLLVYFYPLNFRKHGIGFLVALYIAEFATLYSLIANAFYIYAVQGRKFFSTGASISHAGFALMLFGMIISSSNKEVISNSRVNGINLPTVVDPMTRQQDDPRENLTLLRMVPTTMGHYEVTYTGDSSGSEKGRKYYRMNFVAKDKTGKITETFTLLPDVYQMKDNNMSSNPDTRNYLTKDVFTYLTSALNENAKEDTSSFSIKEMHIGDTSFYDKGYFVLNKVVKSPQNERYNYGKDDMALMADITVVSNDSMRYKAMPLIAIDSLDMINHIDDTIYAQNLFLRFAGVAEHSHVKIGYKESEKLIDFISVKTYIFPYINLVWLGLVIMGIGLALSMLKRFGFNTKISSVALLLIAVAIFYMFLLAN
ncbi:MAG: cytochrome c biogenesis protein CcsA [Chitinophagaceae bacterium]|nr:cytochrome c biogenesis protein CcsA [Chitinophagaceae bacterium]